MAHPTGTCALCNEYRLIVGRELCRRCYTRLRDAGELGRFPRRRFLPFEESLARAQAAATPEGCWPWPKVGRTGYPTTVSLNGVVTQAHVVSWVKVNGPVPAGLELDHLCHTNSPDCPGGECAHRRCVRPDHLEAVTPLENVRRGKLCASPTCTRGHERNEENTAWYPTPKGGWCRRCRRCDKERHEAKSRGSSASARRGSNP